MVNCNNNNDNNKGKNKGHTTQLLTTTDQCQTPLPERRPDTLLGNFPQVMYWAGHSIVWNIPLASSGHLS